MAELHAGLQLFLVVMSSASAPGAPSSIVTAGSPATDFMNL
ncbi:hypothetical protein ACP70R_017174 [Stipagrostis hirtigluma subsp. patula]